MNDTTGYVLRPLGAAIGGVVVAGIGIALTAAVANGVDSGDGWGDLAVVVLGALTSVGLGVLVWLSLLVAAARRLFPAGARLTPVVQSVGGVFGVVALAWAFERGGASGAAPGVVVLAALAAFVVPPAVFALRGRTTPRPAPPTEWPLPPE